MADKLPLGEFAAKIKAKYPQYQSVNDTVLVEKMLAKYPEYSEKVDWPPKKANEAGAQGSAPTSVTSGTPSSASAEPSVATPDFESSNAAYAAEADDRMLAQQAQQNFPVNLGLGQQTQGFGSSMTNAPQVSDVFGVGRTDIVARGADVPEEKQSKWADFVDSVERGSVSVGSMVAGLPDFLYEQTGLGDYEQAIAALGPMSGLGALSKVKDFYAARDAELSNRITQYEDGIVDSALKGNFGDSASQLINAIGESFTPMLMMAATGGVGSGAGAAVQYAGSALPATAGRAIAQNAVRSAPRVAAQALPFASGKWQEIKNDPNVPEGLKPLVAYGSGLSEILYEGSFGTAKLMQQVANKAIGRKGVNQFVKGFMNKALESTGIPAAAFKGGVSEGATQLTNNIIDKFSGVDPDRDLYEGLADAIVTGSAMDAGISAPGSITRSITNRSERKAAQDLSTANESILSDLINPELGLTAEERDALVARYNENDAKITEYIDKARQEREKLTPAQQRLQDDLLARAQSMESLAEKEGLSEETKADLESGISEIESELESIQEEAETEPVSPERQEAEVQPEATVDESAVSEREQTTEIVPEDSATEGQYFTRDIGGEQTVYRKNEDGTTSIVPETEAQEVLSQQAEAAPVSEPIAEEVVTPAQEETEAAAATPAALAPDTQTVSMPVSQITTDESSFQNREGLDQSRVDDIVENFDEVKLDPIVVYNDDGKMVVLSGHHRLAAAQQMGMENIPTKIFKGTKEEAIEFARDSNTLSRAETATERAARYRDMRARGDSEATIKEKARIAHGPEATKVINLSHLSQGGKALDAINSFSKSGDTDTRNKVEAIGDWIGNVKSKHPDLSTRQENEMFDYLMEKYGTKRKSGSVSSRAQFFDVANTLIERAKSKGSFNENTVLNLNNTAGKTGIELEYDRLLQEAKDAVQEARTALDNARKRAVSEGIPSERMTSLLEPLENNLRGALADEAAVRKSKGAVNEAVKAQTSIFDIIQENETEISNTPTVEQRVDDAFRAEQTTDTETTGSTQGTERAKPKAKQRVKQEEGDQDAIQERSPEEVSMGETPGDSSQVEQRVPESGKSSGEVQQKEHGPQEVESVQKEVKSKKKAPSIKEILTSPEARQSRMEELRARIANRPSKGLGIAKDNKAEAEYWRDVTDYAMIRIVDGAITTAKQLAQELGLKQDSRLNSVFKEAMNTITSDPELNVTTARNIDTAKKRAQFGFDERLPLEVESTEEVVAEAKQAIEDGYDVFGLISRIRGGERIGANSLETAILTQYVAANEAEVIRRGDEMERTKESSYNTFMVHSDARDRAMNNLLTAYDALEISGTANARALNIRKALVARDFSLAGMIAERRRAIGGDTVTPQQMAEVEREYRKILKLADEIKARNEELLVENSRLDAENRLMKLKQDTDEAKKKRGKPRTEQVKSTADRRAEVDRKRTEAVNEIKEVWAEWISPGFASLPENKAKSDAKLAKALIKLAQTYIEEGVINTSEIIDKMHSQLKEVIPGLTQKQVMDAIAGSEPDTRPTLSDIRRQLRDFRTELRLLRDIENAEKGVKKYKEGSREREVRNARLDELRARLRAIRESNPDSELKREADLSKAKKNIERRIKDMQKKISDKDFSKPDRDLLAEDPELRRLRKQLSRLQFDYRVENKKYELARRTKSRKFLDAAINIMGVPRAIMATADLSAPLRQGIFVLASHPIMTAKAMGEMFRFWNSKAHYDDYMAEFRESPGHDLAIKSGLSISDQASNVQAAAREEDFMSNLVSKVPIFGETFNIKTKVGGREFQIGDLHGRSERAYVGYLNKMRIDLFEMGVELLQNDGINPTDDPGAYKALARYVNAATGRGPMPDSLKTAGAALSTVFFAPRLITSRLYLLTGGPLVNAPKAVRQMYLRDLVTFVSFGVGLLSAAALMGADVEDDPRSSDFGKMRFGDDRYDIWGGFTQYVTFLAREITGTKLSTTGRERKLDGSEYDRQTRGDLALRFARSKLAPTTALGVSALQGKNYMGEPFDITQELLNMSTPLVLQDIAEAIGDKPAWEIAAGGAAMMFGVGFQSYNANNFLEKGADNNLIDLLNDKKAAAIEPQEEAIKIYDMETGGEKRLSGQEFKRYSRLWSDHMKKQLNDRKAELEKLSTDAFDKEFTKIKRESTAYAKKEMSGVSTYDLKIEKGKITYELTPDQVKTRLELMDQFKKDNTGFKIDYRDNLIDGGMTKEMATIEAEKELDSKARSYSRQVMLEMNEYGEIELVEDN